MLQTALKTTHPSSSTNSTKTGDQSLLLSSAPLSQSRRHSRTKSNPTGPNPRGTVSAPQHCFSVGRPTNLTVAIGEKDKLRTSIAYTARNDRNQAPSDSKFPTIQYRKVTINALQSTLSPRTCPEFPVDCLMPGRWKLASCRSGSISSPSVDLALSPFSFLSPSLLHRAPSFVPSPSCSLAQSVL